MSKCYSCQTIGEHQSWCVGHIAEPKTPIEIPTAPEEAEFPNCVDLGCRAIHMEVPMPERFITKDSGVREQFSTGMVRDTQNDKPRYDLIGWGWALIRRWAELVGRGAIKYGELNFEKAATEAELKRFKSSALRHMVQWFMEETDEDHAAAVCFNLAGAEAVKERLKK